MTNPLISVIIPAYNVEPYIERCVNSVMNQSYKNIEIIIVNDGSEDNTELVVENLAKRFSDKIKVINIPNDGVTRARLTGVSHAKGSWIGFIDGDDTIEPDMYEVLIGNAHKYSADISHCGYKMIFDDGRERSFHGTDRTFEHDTNEALKELLLGRIVEPGLCNKIYKKDLFNMFFEKNQMDFSIRINEDLLMNFILFSYSDKSVFYDVCKYNYIIRRGSASRSKISEHKILDPIKVKEHILNLAPDEVKDIAKRVYIGTCVNAYNAVMLSDEKEYKSYLVDIKKSLKERKDWIALAGRNTKLMASLILNFSFFYKPVYKVYSRYFQEKKYE